MERKKARLLWWILLVGLLLAAFTLRTWDLLAVPPGLTHDEASNGHDSAAILQGVLRIYFPVGYGHEPLYNYSVALLTIFLGQSIFTLRLTSVLWSILLYALTVALARRWWGRRAALFAAAALTCTFWPLMVSRVGLRAPTLPVMITASLLAFDHALAHPTRWRGFIFAGVFLGTGFYTYMASRGLPAIYVVFLPVMLLLNRAVAQRSWKGIIVTLAVAAAIGAPLFGYLHRHPELEYRLTQLGGSLEALKAGDPLPALHNIAASLPMFGGQGDPLRLYNIGGRPAIDTPLAVALVLGLAAAVYRLREPRHTLLLLWLGAGLAPALLTGPEATALRSLAALPAIFLLIALGLEQVWKLAARTRTGRTVAGLALSGLFLILLLQTIPAYFVTWGQNRDVRILYHHHVVALGNWLEARAEETPVVVTSIYPGEFHDPYTMEVTLRRDDLTLRWADGRGALFFPVSASRLITETLSALDPALDALARPYLTLAETIPLRADDLPPEMLVYRWDASAAWDGLLPGLETTVYAAPGDPPPGAPHTAQSLPLTLGNAVSLMGYRVTPNAAAPGNTVEVLTVWQVAGPCPTELVAFTHLLSQDGTLITQADRLDAPCWQWQAGDRFVQVHHLALPPETPAGVYALEVGLYTREGLHRLTLEGSAGAITRVLLESLEIRAP